MHSLVESMLGKYQCKSQEDYENALKEIMQEIALLGMWRTKFFEKGVFYGGTALRILYGLDRFSEDMDFSLLEPDQKFDISKYEGGLKRELESYGFEVTVSKKHKTKTTSIESAFIKANTLIHLIKIKSNIQTHKDKILKIKLEVDTNPPGGYEVDVKSHFNPVPISIKTFTLETLFAGKIAAALFRPYKFNTKGRDWYDFLWYVASGADVNLNYLKSCMVQLQKWNEEEDLTINDVEKLLNDRIEELNLDDAINDVRPFIKDVTIVEQWTKDLFRDATNRLVK